jgi:hypothetical protein
MNKETREQLLAAWEQFWDEWENGKDPTERFANETPLYTYAELRVEAA